MIDGGVDDGDTFGGSVGNGGGDGGDAWCW